MAINLPSYLIDSPFEAIFKQSTSPPLPSAWNHGDSSMFIQVGKNRLRAKYIGAGRDDTEAAAIRTDFPIPQECGLYYYEVEIINKGVGGYIGVGFAMKHVALDRLPGWEEDAYGYHGDDGAKFHAFGRGTEFGPKFTTGDVIGCGINFFNGTAFYTKNGIHLGVAFNDVIGEFYPMIGLRSFPETVEANFGQDKFVFDIDKYAKELYKEVNEGTDISSTIPNTP